MRFCVVKSCQPAERCFYFLVWATFGELMMQQTQGKLDLGLHHPRSNFEKLASQNGPGRKRPIGRTRSGHFNLYYCGNNASHELHTPVPGLGF